MWIFGNIIGHRKLSENGWDVKVLYDNKYYSSMKMSISPCPPMQEIMDSTTHTNRIDKGVSPIILRSSSDFLRHFLPIQIDISPN